MATTEDILIRLTSLAEDSREAFLRLEKEVHTARDKRLAGFVGASGAFVAVVVAVMAYVYNLETRLVGLLFELNAEEAVVSERADVLEERLNTRSNNMAQRWDDHTNDHNSIEQEVWAIERTLRDRERMVEEFEMHRKHMEEKEGGS